MKKQISKSIGFFLATTATLCAQYEGVKFYDTDISGFDFTGMNMEGASLGRYPSNMEGANFTNANVTGANFWDNTRKSGFTEEMWKQTANYQAKALNGSDFYRSDLTGWDFSNMDLRGNSFFTHITDGLIGTDFTNSDIRYSLFNYNSISGFSAAQLYSTKSYKDKDLTGVSFSLGDLGAWNFAGQNLTDTSFSNSVFTDIEGNAADFSDAIIKGADFGSTSNNRYQYTHGRLTAAQIYSTASYKNKDLSGVGFANNDMRGWNFAGQNLTGASFSETSLDNADFSGAIVKDANFSWNRLNNSYYATQQGLTRAQLESTLSFQNKDLGAIDLSGYGGGITSPSEWREWGDMDLSGFNLEGASFQNANVSEINFANANIKGASFRSSLYLTERNVKGLTAAQLYSTASYQSGDLQGVSLYGLDLSGWNFAGKDFSGGAFNFAILSGANFSGTIIKGADLSRTVEYGFTKEQFESTASYINGDLSEIGMQSNDLTGWNFAGKNLNNAQFTNSTLADADFTDAIVNGTSFQGTTAMGFTEEMLKSTASYKNKDLRGIRLINNVIEGWDFSEQNLQNATISSMSYKDVNFTNADLRGAYTLSATNVDLAIYKNTIWSDGVVKNATLASDGDYLTVRNYEPFMGIATSSRNEYVITTKISDADVIMTGGKLIIETGAPLALVQHKSLTADGGQIVMNYGADGFGVINVYGSELGQSNFIITENTEYYIDFGVFGPDADEYLLVDATYGGNIVGDVEDIKYSVWDNGVDVSEEWEFKLVGDQLKLVLVIPEASAYAAVLGLIALAMAAYRRRK